MLLDESLQLGDELGLPARCEVRLDPLLEAREAELLEPGDLALREPQLGELREWRAPPEGQRVLQLSLGPQPPEAGEVDLVGVGTEQVAGSPRQQAVLAEQLPEVRDVHLQRLRRGCGRVFLPEGVDQPLPGHGRVRLENQERQERALLLAPEVERVVVGAHFERPENPEFHRVRS